MRKYATAFAAGLVLAGFVWRVAAQDKAMPMPKPAAPMSADAQIKLAMTAAPSAISKDATIMTADDKMQMTQLRAGTNGWMCMAVPEVMCLDKQWQAWTDAYVHKTDPKVTSIGIAYMLKGDDGASNTDPYAMAPTATNHWVVSPAHMMVITPDPHQLDGLPTDPTSGGPWVMWKGTKFAHIMVPTAPMPKQPTIK